MENFNASNGWRKRFQQRHPEVCTKVVENLHRTRVGGLNVDNVQEYFQTVKEYIRKVEEANGHPIRPDEILNIDETGFDLSNCSKTQRVIIKSFKYRRHRKAQHQGSADRTHFSAAICIDASGRRYPTHYCTVGDIKPFLMEGTECVPTPSGYYTDEAFEMYIDFLLDEAKGGVPNDGRWRIMIVDGYGSHTMVPSALRKLRDRKIWVITMLSHTSHELQPLDVSCFRPTKYFWSWS